MKEETKAKKKKKKRKESDEEEEEGEGEVVDQALTPRSVSGTGPQFEIQNQGPGASGDRRLRDCG